MLLIKPLTLCVSVRQVLIIGVYMTLLSTLYLVPLGLYSPCIKEKGTLGPAPALISHRGAPMVSLVRLLRCTGPQIQSSVRLQSADLDQEHKENGNR